MVAFLLSVFSIFERLEVEKNSRSQIGCNDQSTSNQIEETTKKLLESGKEILLRILQMILLSKFHKLENKKN